MRKWAVLICLWLTGFAWAASKGVEWVRATIAQYPEIQWLADSEVRATQEGIASASQSYSEQIFGKKFIEFDRTLMTLSVLRWVVEGGDAAYAEFICDQPEATRLSRSSFQELHNQAVALLDSRWRGLSREEMGQAMVASLVLGDSGKSKKARTLFGAHGAKAPDHDDFYGEMMGLLREQPELAALVPSYQRLPEGAKLMLSKGANLAHYGHITHLEGSAAMFNELARRRLAQCDPVVQAFDLFVHAIDVAGALGHVNNRSSLVYTENCHRTLQAVRRATFLLADPSKNALDAYNDYLATRAEWLGLDPSLKKDRLLTRMGASLRLYTPEEGQILAAAMEGLSALEQETLLRELDPEPSSALRTPTYIPAVLVNAAGNVAFGESRDERLAYVVRTVLPFIANVLNIHRMRVESGEIDARNPLDFNEIALVVKKGEALSGFTIDEEARVHAAGRS